MDLENSHWNCTNRLGAWAVSTVFPTDYDEFQLILMNFYHLFGIQKWMLRLHGPVSTVRSFLGPFREALSLGVSPNGIVWHPPGAPGLSVRLLTTQLHFLAGEKSSKMTPWLWKTHNTKSHLPKGEWTVGRFPAFFQGNLVCPNHLQVQLVTLTSKLMAPSKAALSKNRCCKCLWCGCGTKVSRDGFDAYDFHVPWKKYYFWAVDDCCISCIFDYLRPTIKAIGMLMLLAPFRTCGKSCGLLGWEVDVRSPWFLIMPQFTQCLKQNMENWRQKDMDWKILTVRNTWKKTQFSWLKPFHMWNYPFLLHFGNNLEFYI